MNKKTIIGLIIGLVIIAVLLIIFMINVINNKNFKWISSGVSKNLIIDEVYSNDFRNLNIDVLSSDIVIKKTTDQNVRIKVYSEKNKPKITQENGNLNIVSNENVCRFFCINFKNTKIEIYINEENLNNIKINNEYGDIDIDSFTKTNLKLDLDCGDAYIKEGNNIVVNNNYGDIKIDKAQVVDIKAAAGDIEIGEVNSAIVKNNYGDIDIAKVNTYIDLEDNCGDIKIKELNLQKDSKIKNDFGDIEIDGTNEIYIESKTELGENEIKNNYRKSDITLTIKNDCGDIEVNN